MEDEDDSNGAYAYMRDDLHNADPANLEKGGTLADADSSSGSPVHFHDHHPNAGLQYYEDRWKRVRVHYSDEYLHLFRSTYEASDDETENDRLTDSQIGSIQWQRHEKSELFKGLARHGKRELLRVALDIGTKSELEVSDFVDKIKQAETDRQMFKAQTKNVAFADIPAAIEIGQECERVLDLASEALTAFQERYDLSVASKSRQLWLVDKDVAIRLDEQHDKSEQHEVESAVEDIPHETVIPEDIGLKSLALFHLGVMLKLGEEVFTNQPKASNDNHKRSLSEDKQPATIMVDTVVELYDIVKNLTRRLVQTVLFIAKSRLRSTSRDSYQPSFKVSRADVEAALDVLSMPADSWDYWKSLPRRAGFKVVDDRHQKGKTRKRILSDDEVEEYLSVRGRSRTSSVSTSVTNESEKQSVRSSSDMSPDESIEEHVDPDDYNQVSNSEQEITDIEEMQDSVTDEESLGSIQDRSSSLYAPVRYKTTRERLQELDRRDDVYLENLDQLSRQQAEAEILQLLRKENEPVEEQLELNEIGARPMIPRKTYEDLNPWSCAFEAQWERDGEAISPSTFDEQSRSSKRRKVEQEAPRTELIQNPAWTELMQRRRETSSD